MLEFEFVRDNHEDLCLDEKITKGDIDLRTVKVRNTEILRLYGIDVNELAAACTHRGRLSYNYTTYIALGKEGLIDITLPDVQDILIVDTALFNIRDITKEILDAFSDQLSWNSAMDMLINAVKYNHKEMMQLYMSYRRIKHYLSHHSFRTSLYERNLCGLLRHVKGGRDELANMIIDNTGALEAILEVRDTQIMYWLSMTYEDAMMYAVRRVCKAGHEKSLDVLRRMGMTDDYFTRDNYRALELAVTYGRLGIVERCIDLLNLGDILKGWLARMMKCQESIKIVKLLRDRNYITESEKNEYLKRLPTERPCRRHTNSSSPSTQE
jgi:hypothetical protein